MKLKKTLSAALAAAMILGLTACGGGGGGADSSKPAGSTPAESRPAASTPAASGSTDVGDVANDPKVTLVYAEVNPLDTIVGQTASEFKRLV